MNLLELAESIARKAHEGQFRRDGVTPYIAHPERVVARLKASGASEDSLALAWLHDAVEDGGTSWEAIYASELPNRICLGLRHLTKGPHEKYEDYLKLAAKYSETKAVKIADILDNLSDAPTENQIIKYCKALLYLHGK